jgi:hypothetical protein
MKAAILPSRRLPVRHNSIELRIRQHPTDGPNCNVLVLNVSEGLLSGRRMSPHGGAQKGSVRNGSKEALCAIPSNKFHLWSVLTTVLPTC